MLRLIIQIACGAKTASVSTCGNSRSVHAWSRMYGEYGNKAVALNVHQRIVSGVKKYKVRSIVSIESVSLPTTTVPPALIRCA